MDNPYLEAYLRIEHNETEYPITVVKEKYEMQLKQNAKYAIVAPTSMGVRITPKDRQPVQISHDYVMYATSAESNVLNVAASLGMNTRC